MVLGRCKEMGEKMAFRRLLISIFESISNFFNELAGRLKYIDEMRIWELEKRQEGFPEEWFSDE